MVICKIYSGEIIVEPKRNRRAGEMVKAHQVLVGWSKKCGVAPKRHILGNETSE